MAHYDPKIIEQHSNRLYFSADISRWLFPVGGLLLGFGIGYGVFKTLGAVVGGASGVYIGKRMGELKALEIKAKAQQNLCLARIEENTRERSGSGESV
jgi:outer membrane lipoprotein SlyB